ncbi:hypothetical protein Tco_0830475 [Tanacetum coccineum]
MASRLRFSCFLASILSLGTSLDPSWSELELHLSGDKFLRSVDLQGGRCMRVFGYKKVTRRCLEALELKGGDGGACKLLGNVIEVLGCLLEVLVYVRYNGYGIDCIEVSWPCDGSIEDLDVLWVDLE